MAARDYGPAVRVEGEPIAIGIEPFALACRSLAASQLGKFRRCQEQRFHGLRPKVRAFLARIARPFIESAAQRNRQRR